MVNISSILGTHATPGMAPYSMSKAALDMLTRYVGYAYKVVWICLQGRLDILTRLVGYAYLR